MALYGQQMERITSPADQKKLQALLRQIRVEAGLTQEEVARRLDRPQSFVSKYETGERRPDILELRAVLAALGLSLGEFVHRLEASLP
jgi:transcriptional regulator with XRE-family HTH domain